MDDTLRPLLEQTFTLGPLGTGFLLIFILVVIPFVIARPPTKPDPTEHPVLRAHGFVGNLMWLAIFAVCLLAAAGIVGATFGIQILPTIRPGG